MQPWRKGGGCQDTPVVANGALAWYSVRIRVKHQDGQVVSREANICREELGACNSAHIQGAARTL